MSIQVERWPENNAPQAADLKRRLESEGYSVFQWSDAPGTKYGPHAHAEAQTHWILSGELELRVGYEIYKLGPGDRVGPAQHVLQIEAGRDRARPAA